MTEKEILTVLWQGKTLHGVDTNEFYILQGASNPAALTYLSRGDVLPLLNNRLVSHTVMGYRLTDAGLTKIGKPTKAELNKVID